MKQRQASELCSSLPVSFFSRGCFSGSLEWRHSSSDRFRLGAFSVPLSVRLGGNLDTREVEI